MSQWEIKSSNSRRGPADWLTRQIRDDEIRSMVAQSLSDKEIARRTGLCDRTVFRIRHRLGLPNIYGRSTAGRVGR